MRDVVHGDWVHMMNIHSPVDSIAVHAEVTAQVPRDHIVPNSLPLVGMVESLVEVAVEAECVFTHLPVQFQILIPLKESRELLQLRICPNTLRILHHRHARCNAGML